MLPAMSTATTRPQIAMIPAMTTGITDFMMNSGFMTAMAEIPQPDLAVPQAAPSAICFFFVMSHVNIKYQQQQKNETLKKYSSSYH